MHNYQRVKVLDLRPRDHKRLFDMHELHVLTAYCVAALESVRKSCRVDYSVSLNYSHNFSRGKASQPPCCDL